MVCRSCGNTYDYDYFGEENLLKAASKALSDGDYSAAKDMYSFMLDKEPSNVQALKGLLLANNRVNKLYDITAKIKEGKFIPGTFNLDKYRNDSDPEAAKFFDSTDKVLALYKEYDELKKTGESLESEEDNAERELEKDSGESFFYYESDDSLKKKVIAASVVLVILGICAFVFGSDYETSVWLMAILIIAMIVTLFVIVSALLRILANKKERKDPVMNKLDSIDAGQEENKLEMYRVIREINAIFKEMNSY